jgi:hypothetical protein
MKKAVGIVLVVLGGLLILVLLPFLAHALVNVVFVLLVGRPVPGWWWGLIAPIQNIVALPIVAFAFVIKVGPTMSLVIPLLVELVFAAVGAVLLWLGLRIARKGRKAEQ